MKTVAAGALRKMRVRLDRPVSYRLRLGETELPLNPLLGETIRIRHTGRILCLHCGGKTARSYNDGYCYRCFRKLARCDSCIVHPERCHFDRGTCREPVWGERHCMRDHIVYLANSSGLKVGITRATQVPTRWIDQGATQALAVIRVRSRLQSGLLEVMFKQRVADKTNWRDMLKGPARPMDMAGERDRLLDGCRAEIDGLRERLGIFSVSVLNGIEPAEIEYPVAAYPRKIASIGLDKRPDVKGRLRGIKGQYLILDAGVINLRGHSGYEVEFGR